MRLLAVLGASAALATTCCGTPSTGASCTDPTLGSTRPAGVRACAPSCCAAVGADPVDADAGRRR